MQGIFWILYGLDIIFKNKKRRKWEPQKCIEYYFGEVKLKMLT